MTLMNKINDNKATTDNNDNKNNNNLHRIIMFINTVHEIEITNKSVS